MEMMADDAPGSLICVQTTIADAKFARAFAKQLVDQRLAACVQQVRVSSTYGWDGTVREEAEHLLTIKTTLGALPRLEAFMAANHPYDVPECLVLPARGASEAYAAWVRQAVG
ncbi:MAG: divalent-cation tolerance protein CutA [Devosiaceae bacterium]|nr:divalent-cation tolerance protein CutA [Devosiaceae bacterium MH13]